MKKIIASIFFAVSAMALVSGCSSSSDSTPPPSTLTGTAATGAPISGTVFVKDAKGVEKSVATGVDGSFKLDVPGMTPPYLLKIMPASGPELYSFASQNGQTVNLTPMTNTAMFLAYGKKDLNALYVGWDGAGVTAAAIDDAEGIVRANLETQITAQGIDAAGYDLFTSSFSADGKGIDAVMDDLKVILDTSAGTVTFTDASDLDMGFDEGITPITPPATPAPSGAISIVTVSGASHALNGTYKTGCYINEFSEGEIDSLVITGAAWLNSSAIYAGDTTCSAPPSSTKDIEAVVTKGSTKTVTWLDGMGTAVDPMLAADGSTSMVGTTVTLLSIVISASYDPINIPVDAQFTAFYVVDDTAAGLITMYRDDDTDLGLVSTADPYIR